MQDCSFKTKELWADGMYDLVKRCKLIVNEGFNPVGWH